MGDAGGLEERGSAALGGWLRMDAVPGWPSERNRISGLARGVRSLLRRVAGRQSAIWRLLRSPRLRYAAFGDIVDCVVYSLLITLPRVRFVQIGSNDGRTGDPLWTFRRYPNWSGVLVEPVAYLFRRLHANYGGVSDRFTLVEAAVATESGILPFHHLRESSTLPPGYDQLGSLDERLARSSASGIAADASLLTTSYVRCMTFGELCDRKRIDHFDLLHVDAEGYDGEIVLQVDFDRYSPHIILFEHVHMSRNERTDVRHRLETVGYTLRLLGQDTLAIRRASLHLPAVGWAASLGRSGADEVIGGRE
jgi:FkbM family methyltransferase